MAMAWGGLGVGETAQPGWTGDVHQASHGRVSSEQAVERTGVVCLRSRGAIGANAGAGPGESSVSGPGRLVVCVVAVRGQRAHWCCLLCFCCGIERRACLSAVARRADWLSPAGIWSLWSLDPCRRPCDTARAPRANARGIRMDHGARRPEVEGDGRRCIRAVALRALRDAPALLSTHARRTARTMHHRAERTVRRLPARHAQHAEYIARTVPSSPSSSSSMPDTVALVVVHVATRAVASSVLHRRGLHCTRPRLGGYCHCDCPSFSFARLCCLESSRKRPLGHGRPLAGQEHARG